MGLTSGHLPSLFADRRFVGIWLVGCLTGVVRWLELLAFGLYAIDVTGSPSLVALLALMRFLPLVAAGIFVGAVADLVDARKLLIGGLAGIVVVNFVMFLLFAWNMAGYWQLAAAALLSGLFWTCDLPLRRRMIGELVPIERIAEAMSLDNATSNGTRMLGPLFGGVIYQTVGITGVFAIGVAMHAVSLALIILVLYAAALDKPAGGNILLRPLRGAARAVAYSWQHLDVLRIFGVTIVFNLWGFPFVSMIPVIGKEDLALSPAWIGYVASIEGAFALTGALVVARLARNPDWFRKIYYYGTFAHLCAVTFIGLVPGFWPLVFGLMAAGSFAACLATMQSTLIYSVSPPEMRGRLLGLMTICIGTGLIGFANVGIMAELFGAANALWIIGLEGVIPMLLIGWRWRELRG